MNYDAGEYGFPVKPAPAGKSAMQGMGEALNRQEDHNQWHCDHPGEPCPEGFWNNGDYKAIERGENMLRLGGGGTFTPGGSMTPGKE